MVAVMAVLGFVPGQLLELVLCVVLIEETLSFFGWLWFLGLRRFLGSFEHALRPRFLIDWKLRREV